MDNPNPIYYKDLVTPDDSITQLIDQISRLIDSYESAKKKIQGAAAETAKSLESVSAATEEQRKTIERSTKQSDELAAKYSHITEEERKQQRVLLTLKQAQKEKNDIDKLVVRLATSQEGSYNRLSAQYRLNKIRLNEMSEAERHGTEAGRQLETETRKIYERMSELQKATGKYTLEVGHYENAMRALPGPLTEVIGQFTTLKNNVVAIGKSDMPLASKAISGFSSVLMGSVGIILTLVGSLGNGVKRMREFEQANADLSTILGVNVKDMKALTNAALELGRSTEYTASQVTQLQTELAKLGFGQGSILAMEKSVLQFATAVGANLGEAAEVAGATLRAFNLTSKDSEEVLATLAVATNNSALNFDKIRTSIGTVFPVANAFGFSVKDTTALLGALANAGFDASSAATATRNILLNMANANGKLAKSLGGSVSTFDEMIDGLIKLRKSGIDLNEALELTDKRSVAAFSAFISGAEKARELRQSLEDVGGELDRIQSERLNTVEGSTKLLQSAWEGLTLAFNKSNGAIKSTIDWLTKLVTATQKALFPTETAIQENAADFTERFQKYYAEAGADAAKAYMQRSVEAFKKESEKANEAAESSNFLGRWFGVGKAQKDVKTWTVGLQAIEQAVNIVTTQIENDAAEAADAAKQKAEQEADAAKQKAQELTKEEKKRIEQQKKQLIANRKAVIESVNNEIAVTTAGTEEMLQLRLDKVNAERELELEQNRQKTESERQDEAAINAKYAKKILDTRTQFYNEVSQMRVKNLQAELQSIQLQTAVTKEVTDEMLALRLAAIDKQREIELEQNSQLTEELRQDEAAINAKYDAQVLKQTADFYTKKAEIVFAAQQDLAQSEFNLQNRNDRQKEQFSLKQERERLNNILELNETASTKLRDEEVATIQNTIAAIDKERKSLPYDNLYEVLGIGIDDKQQDALNTAFDSIIDSISSIIDSWQEAAKARIDAANSAVESAQSELDAEIQARDKGYANNVSQAQKNLELKKQELASAEKEQEKAAKAQMALQTAMQTSSLITATANIWAALGGIAVVGPALAIAAIAGMWASFAVSKVKAAQVASTGTEQYGEGTVELLEGGSHASGNDIDMGTKKDGTKRRAEGGEFFAIINKKNSRRYRDVIPDVVNSFNDGSFADKYQKTNEQMSNMAFTMMVGNGTDVSKLEHDVRAIRTQGAESRYVDSRGNMVVRYKNLTRTIRHA